MERLEFGGSSRYIAIEASIHVARYLAAKDFCKGRTVLDIACGEGYGSWLMSQWGAKSVFGVDVADDAVQKAKLRFGSASVDFACGRGEDLPKLVQDQRFDLIVSLETIEHVDDPELFLKNLRVAATDDATIIISAPNDYWYYDLGGQNEFHKRRFTFEEFRDLTERVLGKAASWSLGTLGIGFSVSKVGGSLKSGSSQTPQDLMLDFEPIQSAVYVPSQIESDVSTAEAAFYVGVWGPQPIAETIFAGYPVSMNLGRQALFPREGIWAIKQDASDPNSSAYITQLFSDRLRLAAERDASLSAQVDSLGEKLYLAEKEVERLGMSRRAAQAEVAVAWRAISRHEQSVRELRDVVDAQRRELEIANGHLASVPWNIVRAWWSARKLIPTPLLRFVGRVLHSLRRSHAN
ncbi:glycosyltransferase [Burkholderia sp. SJ98]|uniref:class I SAM-dependent methyltransferase n=1 Tax=Caballeronia zhejiangensis TaxID=871203 RepID=UPI00025BC7F5|nr:class I SAM-dependent methyltransferase [Caballeronia zhejiangensis]EKS73263.1 glycosyltransferase [Burkholderia sp. SJ98]